ncbi:hypothetical protein LOD99_1077 [Oopsacas minuta]|uniref:Uncharacterized protein n=1 Tax=Oopsacas minuta TaxID=111878 RepID=A0AAV7K160_9METZ|nr:hypothetical protein LOD99_1077 [Oopsacas minuta]
MASVEVKIHFIEQGKENKKKIRDCFKRLHEALRLRESNLISYLDQNEEYISNNQEIKKLLENLNKYKLISAETLSSNELADIHGKVEALINNKIEGLTAETDRCIEFEWNNQFETQIEQLGNIKSLTVKDYRIARNKFRKISFVSIFFICLYFINYVIFQRFPTWDP